MTVKWNCNKIETNRSWFGNEVEYMIKKVVGILAVMMILLSLPGALSEYAPAGINVGINWIDDDGFLYTEYASPVSYAGYENAYWLMVPEIAQGRMLTLFIEDTSGQYASFMPGNGTELYNYSDAGTDISAAGYTEIYCFDQNMVQTNTIRLYLSTSAEYPSQPSVLSATVTVRYLDSVSGSEIRSELIECPGNEVTTVTAPELPGYVLQSEGIQYVSVDPNGNPDRYGVDFYYMPAATAPVINVRYIDMNTGSEIRQADYQTCEINTTTTINAPTIDGYILSGDAQAYVTVDGMGNASTGEVIFYYSAVQAPVVTVRYIDMNTGSEIRQADYQTCEINTTTTIDAPTIDGYILSGAARAYVTVDAAGIANTGEVTFNYTVIPDVYITVSYVDQSTSAPLAEPESIYCPRGESITVIAKEIQGYQLLSDSVETVYVDASGSPSKTEIVFKYLLIEAPSVSVRYLDALSSEEIAPAGSVTCPLDQETEILASQIPGYTVMEPSRYTVAVNSKGIASIDSLTFYYQRVQAPLLQVRYIESVSGQDIIAPSDVICELDTSTVIQAVDIVGYRLSGEDRYTVTVDQNGIADQTRIIFTYEKISDPVITIAYLDADTGSDIIPRETQTCPLGTTTTVYAHGIEGYVIEGSGTVDVVVDAQGQPSMEEVAFRFRKVNAPSVPVYYQDENGNAVADTDLHTCALKESTTIYHRNIPGYELLSDPSVVVSVDANGIAVPDSVTFVYRAIEAPVIPVYFFEANTETEILPAKQIVCGLKETMTVEAEKISGYVLAGNASQAVSVDENGVPTPDRINFYYNRIQSPTIVIHYQDVTTKADLIAPVSETVDLNSRRSFTAADIDGYTVLEPTQAEVYVDENGVPDKEQICFSYSAIPAPAAVIRYVDEQGQSIISNETVMVPLGQSVTVSAKVIDGYTLNSPQEQTVEADKYGNITSSEIVFTYEAIPAPTVVIRFVEADTGKALLPDETRQFALNSETDVTARGISGHVIRGDEQVTVKVDAMGHADPAEITFVYQAIDAPAVTVMYLDEETGAQIAQPGSHTCPLNESTVIRPVYIDGYITPDETYAVYVDANGIPDREQVTFYYKQVRAPEIVVHYRNTSDMSEITDPDTTVCPIGRATYISAKEIPGYTVMGESVIAVNVDQNGVPSASEIVFNYSAIDAPAVVVKCLSQDGRQIRDPEYITCAVGQQSVIAAPDIEGYSVVGDREKTVIVDASGKASPNEVSFSYISNLVIVRIEYRIRNNGREIYSTSQTFRLDTVNTINVDMSLVPDGFELDDESAKTVSIDPSGIAAPSEVVFYFRVKSVASVNITVRYLDENGEAVASPSLHECYVGNNYIKAEPLDLKAGYHLADDEVVEVFINADGSAEPEEAIFIYYPEMTVAPVTAEPTPDATEFPYAVEPVDIYAFPSSSSINIRSTPESINSRNIIGKLLSTDMIRLTGQLTTNRGETWYMTEVEGVTGFVNSKVVRFATPDEINAAFGYTATPAPTQIPDGFPIERWAATNKSNVNIRTETSTRSSKVKLLEKRNSSLWVYDSLTVDGVKWYHVNVNGSDGYVMAEYITLRSEEDSLSIQASLKSPVPTHTPAPTHMATSYITATPTPYMMTAAPIVSDIPVETQAPPQYAGYAITIRDTRLYSSADLNQARMFINENSLVLIKAQTYISGLCWDSVDCMSTGDSGFMLDTDLRHISNEEARAFLEGSIATPSPTAIATPVPVQQTGFAATMGDNVVMRSFPDPNAQILAVLPNNVVVLIYGQEFSQDYTWDLVNIDGDWGYIRHDLLRMLNEYEIAAYLNTLKTPTPMPAATPTAVPITGYNLSSYGYISGDKVRMRADASMDAQSLKVLDRYAFALVLGQKEKDGVLWYNISQGGTQGYVRGDLFKVLTIDELSSFLGSDEYKNSNSNTVTRTSTSSDSIAPYEDYTVKTWQNPALSVSYEPFTVGTPSPAATYAASDLATPTVTASVEPLPTSGIGGLIDGSATRSPDPDQTQSPGEKAGTSSNALGFILAAGALALGGGGVYAYVAHKQNQKRRQSVLDAQMRAASARREQAPHARPAANNPNQRSRTTPQAGTMNKAPFMPPSGAPNTTSARNASAQFTAKYPPDDNGTKQATGVYKATSTQSSVESDSIWQRKNNTITTPPVRQPGSETRAPQASTETKTGTPVQRHRRSEKYRNSDDT